MWSTPWRTSPQPYRRGCSLAVSTSKSIQYLEFYWQYLYTCIYICVHSVCTVPYGIMQSENLNLSTVHEYDSSLHYLGQKNSLRHFAVRDRAGFNKYIFFLYLGETVLMMQWWCIHQMLERSLKTYQKEGKDIITSEFLQRIISKLLAVKTVVNLSWLHV